MCYILDPMKQEVAKNVVMGGSTDRVCTKIHKMNGETCTLRHAKRAATTGAPADWRALRRAVTAKAGIIYE